MNRYLWPTYKMKPFKPQVGDHVSILSNKGSYNGSCDDCIVYEIIGNIYHLIASNNGSPPAKNSWTDYTLEHLDRPK